LKKYDYFLLLSVIKDGWKLHVQREVIEIGPIFEKSHNFKTHNTFLR